MCDAELYRPFRKIHSKLIVKCLKMLSAMFHFQLLLEIACVSVQSNDTWSLTDTCEEGCPFHVRVQPTLAWGCVFPETGTYVFTDVQTIANPLPWAQGLLEKYKYFIKPFSLMVVVQ